jgi:hypothetical protein
MARAPFVVRKDGRYFFHKRFVSVRFLAGRPTHMRLSLRTAVYREAVERLLRVMRMVQLCEIDDDIVSRAGYLAAEMKRLNAVPGGHDVSQMVERRALEIVVDRLVAEARHADHPLTVAPEEFWQTWMAFCAVNGMLEKEAFHRPPGTRYRGGSRIRLLSLLAGDMRFRCRRGPGSRRLRAPERWPAALRPSRCPSPATPRPPTYSARRSHRRRSMPIPLSMVPLLQRLPLERTRRPQLR